MSTKHAFKKIKQACAFDRVGNERQDEDEKDHDAQDRPFQPERGVFVDDGRMTEAHLRLELEEKDEGGQDEPGQAAGQDH